ncbi:MAG: aminodeoxychorismate lyase [Salinisphaeraceae bacterium]|nr:aminodeoxychorismate lyase [Salinisphaeraceae bacterium]
MSGVAARVNGQPADSLSILDRGLHYGDGVFRTLPVRGGRPLAWQAYQAALADDCRRLDLPSPSAEQWRADCSALFADGGDGVLKCLVTRGVGGRGYRPAATPEITRICLRYPEPPTRPAALAIGWSRQLLGRNRQLAGIKHLNRLEQVLAARELEGTDEDELLLCDENGGVISGSMSNLFLQRGGQLMTPSLEFAGIAGVTRGLILEQASRAGLDVHVTDLSRSDVEQADGLFLCNSLLGIRPVKQLDGTPRTVSDLTGTLQQLLEQARQP